jgi:hypothetical protein
MTPLPVLATLRRATSHRCGYQLELRVLNHGPEPVTSWQAVLAFGPEAEVTPTETSTVVPGGDDGVFIVAPVREGTVAGGAEHAVFVDVRCTTSPPVTVTFTATTRDGASLDIPVSDAAVGTGIVVSPPGAPPAREGSAGQPPVLGYRALAPAEIGRINTVKQLERQVADTYRAVLDEPGTDPQWAQTARDYLEIGFMALTRAVARPHSPFDAPVPQPSSSAEAGPAAAR